MSKTNQIKKKKAFGDQRVANNYDQGFSMNMAPAKRLFKQ